MYGHNLFIIFFVLLLLCKSYSQNKQIVREAVVNQFTEQQEQSVTVFLDIDFVGDVNIYNNAHDKVIATIRNNIEDEDFILFDLLLKNDSMFYVIAYHSLEDTPIAKGWVFKNKHFGIYDRMYCPQEEPLILYENSNDTSPIIVMKAYYEPVIHEVIDFSGNWVKIKTKIDGKIYEGWLPPEMQCCNVYSTCS